MYNDGRKNHGFAPSDSGQVLQPLPGVQHKQPVTHKIVANWKLQKSSLQSGLWRPELRERSASPRAHWILHAVSLSRRRHSSDAELLTIKPMHPSLTCQNVGGQKLKS